MLFIHGLLGRTIPSTVDDAIARGCGDDPAFPGSSLPKRGGIATFLCSPSANWRGFDEWPQLFYRVVADGFRQSRFLHLHFHAGDRRSCALFSSCVFLHHPGILTASLLRNCSQWITRRTSSKQRSRSRNNCNGFLRGS